MTRMCRDCQRAFEISVEEQQFFARLIASGTPPEGGAGWCLPARCTACRAARRRARLAVPLDAAGWYEQTCSDCAATFPIGPKDVAYYQARGWPWPKRCKACRAARAQRSAPGRP